MEQKIIVKVPAMIDDKTRQKTVEVVASIYGIHFCSLKSRLPFSGPSLETESRFLSGIFFLGNQVLIRSP